MNASKKRREALFRNGKPTIRPVVYDDIRWMWVASKRDGGEETPEEFTRRIEPYLASADKLFMLEDVSKEFDKGDGPVGLVLSNYDGWSLIPHVEWFPWATPRNILRCTVGFLQSMRYSHDIGIIKIYAEGIHAEWFKKLKRYISVCLIGRIPHGRESGEECIFYLRGRKNVKHRQESVRRVGTIVNVEAENNTQAASHIG